MKQLMTVAALAIAATAAMNTARAADVQGKIPFDFFAGDKKLAAGTYRISEVSNGRVLTLQDKNGGAGAFVIGNAIQATGKNAPLKLVFRKIGEHYVLGQVWSGLPTGRETTRSRAEKALMREAGTKVAVVLVEIPIAAE